MTYIFFSLINTYESTINSNKSEKYDTIEKYDSIHCFEWVIWHNWVIYKLPLLQLKIVFKPIFSRLLIQFSEILLTNTNLLHLSSSLVKNKHENNYEQIITKNILFFHFCQNSIFFFDKNHFNYSKLMLHQNLENTLNKHYFTRTILREHDSKCRQILNKLRAIKGWLLYTA